MGIPSANPAVAAKRSAYARSRTLRIGLWALAGAGSIIAWHAVQDYLIASRENLVTLEGTVVEHRSIEISGASRVRLSTGGTSRIQGNRQLKTVLGIRKNDGTLTEFTASEWFPTPKVGWKGQPIRVQHDSLWNLYEIVVAEEIIRDVETTRKYRRIDNKRNQGLWIFLLLIGVPLTIVGYILSFQRTDQGPPPLPAPMR